MEITPTNLNFGETILDLQEKKRRLLEQKQQIERQIEVMDRTVESLIFLGDPQAKMPLPYELSEMGLQDAVRSIFRRSYPLPLLPTEVRNVLISAGAYKPSYKNLLVAIHSAIGRMGDELEKVRQVGGKMAYRWKVKGERD